MMCSAHLPAQRGPVHHEIAVSAQSAAPCEMHLYTSGHGRSWSTEPCSSRGMPVWQDWSSLQNLWAGARPSWHSLPS